MADKPYINILVADPDSVPEVYVEGQKLNKLVEVQFAWRTIIAEDKVPHIHPFLKVKTMDSILPNVKVPPVRVQGFEDYQYTTEEYKGVKLPWWKRLVQKLLIF